jgi:hypothetical protein
LAGDVTSPPPPTALYGLGQRTLTFWLWRRIPFTLPVFDLVIMEGSAGDDAGAGRSADGGATVDGDDAGAGRRTGGGATVGAATGRVGRGCGLLERCGGLLVTAAGVLVFGAGSTDAAGRDRVAVAVGRGAAALDRAGVTSRSAAGMPAEACTVGR